jgi:hypothetical protein
VKKTKIPLFFLLPLTVCCMLQSCHGRALGARAGNGGGSGQRAGESNALSLEHSFLAKIWIGAMGNYDCHEGDMWGLAMAGAACALSTASGHFAGEHMEGAWRGVGRMD